jgi:hypothetical protein
MRDSALADLGYNFHVIVGMRSEARTCSNFIVIPDANIPPAHACRIMVTGKTEVMVGIQPAVIGFSKGREWTLFNSTRSGIYCHRNISTSAGVKSPLE